jgi:hypothetical protein
MLRTVTATRYIKPLREGGSLPAVVEADDGLLYAMKFSGAGQGCKALIAELVAGEIARLLNLPIPEIVFIELDPVIGRSEPNTEIQDILQRSVGLNLGLRYLSGALPFDPLLQSPTPELASRIVWFDAYITNVDRTARNVNMLNWQNQLWLIDHGASLYFHHAWQDYLTKSRSAFPMIIEHVLLPFATELGKADSTMRHQLTEPLLQQVIELIPTVWLKPETIFATQTEHRAGYISYLLHRLNATEIFVKEAEHVRAKLV